MEEISDFIAQDSPSAAAKWIDAVFEKAELLKSSPEMGRIVPEIGLSSIREIVFGNYRIVYILGAKSIQVLSVRSFKQILPIDEILDS